MIKALQAHGIEVTALHSHMLSEQPRMFFLHFWANDDALKLATGLRAALDKSTSRRTPRARSRRRAMHRVITWQSGKSVPRRVGGP